MKIFLKNVAVFIFSLGLVIQPSFATNSYAQSQAKSAVVDLTDAEWQAMPLTIANFDASISIFKFTYIFDKQGKVTHYVSQNKGIGTNSVSILSTPSYDPQTNNSGERRLVLTDPNLLTTSETGTYTVTGKSIFFDFPTYTISATINSDSMKGIKTSKGDGKKEEWWVAKMTDDPVLASTSTSTPTKPSEPPRPIPLSGLELIKRSQQVLLQRNAIAEGFWDFNLNIDRLVRKDGQVRNEQHSFKWTIDFDVVGSDLIMGENIVTGKIISVTGDRGEAVCADAIIKGTFVAGRLEFTVTYHGSCCNQGQMIFAGAFNIGSNTSINGMLMPSRFSDSASCSMPYANVVATKR